MGTALEAAIRRGDAERPEPLENGERLTAGEFLRRYEAMPEVKKAELIEGIASKRAGLTGKANLQR